MSCRTFHILIILCRYVYSVSLLFVFIILNFVYVCENNSNPYVAICNPGTRCFLCNRASLKTSHCSDNRQQQKSYIALKINRVVQTVNSDDINSRAFKHFLNGILTNSWVIIQTVLSKGTNRLSFSFPLIPFEFAKKNVLRNSKRTDRAHFTVPPSSGDSQLRWDFHEMDDYGGRYVVETTFDLQPDPSRHVNPPDRFGQPDLFMLCGSQHYYLELRLSNVIDRKWEEFPRNNLASSSSWSSREWITPFDVIQRMANQFPINPAVTQLSVCASPQANQTENETLFAYLLITFPRLEKLSFTWTSLGNLHLFVHGIGFPFRIPCYNLP